MDEFSALFVIHSSKVDWIMIEDVSTVGLSTRRVAYTRNIEKRSLEE